MIHNKSHKNLKDGMVPLRARDRDHKSMHALCHVASRVVNPLDMVVVEVFRDRQGRIAIRLKGNQAVRSISGKHAPLQSKFSRGGGRGGKINSFTFTYERAQAHKPK